MQKLWEWLLENHQVCETARGSNPEDLFMDTFKIRLLPGLLEEELPALERMPNLRALQVWKVLSPRGTEQLNALLARLPNLEKFDFDGWDMDKVPLSNLGKLQGLKQLHLWTFSKEGKIPEDMFLLSNLMDLHWESISQTLLPDRFAELPLLQTLRLEDLSSNPVCESVFGLRHLKCLEILNDAPFDARLCKFRDLEWLGGRFRELEIGLDNYMEAVPKGAFPMLKGLKVASKHFLEMFGSYERWDQIEHLEIQSLEEKDLSFFDGRLSQLRTLRIHYCGLTEVPAWIYSLTQLEFLDLSENHQLMLSDKLLEIPSLRSLAFSDVEDSCRLLGNRINSELTRRRARD